MRETKKGSNVSIVQNDGKSFVYASQSMMNRYAGSWKQGEGEVVYISPDTYGMRFDGNPVNYDLGLRKIDPEGEEALCMSFQIEEGDSDVNYIISINDDDSLSFFKEAESGNPGLVKTLQK